MKFVEAYRDYTPPFPLVPKLRSALRVVPAKNLAGLNRIVLTNIGALPRRRRRAKTRSGNLLPVVFGLYHPTDSTEQPHIEIFVDNHFKGKSPKLYLARHLSAFFIAGTMFHEVGHHIHYTKWPEQGDIERVAEKYQWVYTRRLFFRWLHLHAVALLSVLLNVRLWPKLWAGRKKLYDLTFTLPLWILGKRPPAGYGKRDK